jgi:hypothetical protein
VAPAVTHLERARGRHRRLRPFDADDRLERWRAEKSKTLSSYGWVDRGKGLIHIPVEEAMKELLRQNPARRRRSMTAR